MWVSPPVDSQSTLKRVRDGAIIRCSRSLLQVFTTLLLKLFALLKVFKQSLSLYNFLECPLMELYVGNV